MAAEIVVLITGAGGSGTIEIIRQLRSYGRYRIIAADAERYSVGFLGADKSYVVPFGSSPDFAPALAEIIERERPHFLIPLVDEEILKAHDVAAAASYKLKVVAPTRRFCELCLDKWETFQALRGASIELPRTYRGDDVREDVFPAVVKPRHGRGSRGVAYVESEEELDRYFELSSVDPANCLVQEKLLGAEYTVSCIGTLDGRLLQVVPKEVLIKRGITQVGITRVEPAFAETAREIFEKLEPNGPFNLQAFLTPEGAVRIIELNPRYSTTVALTLAAGVDELDLVIRHALGESVEASAEFKPDLLMVRYVTQVWTSEDEWPGIAHF